MCRQKEPVRMIGAPRSPDQNHMDHLWGRRFRSILRRCQKAPPTARELSDALVRIWEEIPQDDIRSLVTRRARGSHAKYRVLFEVTGRKFQQHEQTHKVDIGVF